MTNFARKNAVKRFLGFFLKLGFSAVVLYLIFSSIDIRQLAAYLKNAGLKTFVLILVAGMVLWLTEYLRFSISLKPVIDEPLKTPLRRIFFSGYALRFIIPGGHGEVGKMAFVSGPYSYRLIAYLMDKGSLAAVVLIGGLAGIWKLYPTTRVYYRLLVIIIPLVCFGAGYIIRKSKKGFPGIGKYPFKNVLAANIPLSIAHVMIMALQYWLVLKAYGVSFFSTYTTVNIVLCAIMIPISFAGLGVREWTTLQLLKFYSLPKESAILAPLLVFLCNVFIPALIGAIVILFFKMKPKLFPKDSATLHQQR